MEISNLCMNVRKRAFERKLPKTPEQVGASWYNDDLTYDGVSKTLFVILPTPGCAWHWATVGDVQCAVMFPTVHWKKLTLKL